MNPIPQKLRKWANDLDFYKQCCYVSRVTGNKCKSKLVQYHHPIIYSRRQISEIFLPVCKSCHDKVDQSKEYKDYFIWVALLLHKEYLEEIYYKHDWHAEYVLLSKMFENISEVVNAKLSKDLQFWA